MEKCRSNEVLIQQYRYSSQSIQLSCGSSSLVHFLRSDLSEGLPVLVIKFAQAEISGGTVVLPYQGNIWETSAQASCIPSHRFITWEFSGLGGNFRQKGVFKGLWQTQKTICCSEGKVQSKQIDVNFKPYEAKRDKCISVIDRGPFPFIFSISLIVISQVQHSSTSKKHFCSLIATPIPLPACNI